MRCTFWIVIEFIVTLFLSFLQGVFFNLIILKSSFCFYTPTTKEEWLHIAELFESQWNFPNCIGALDGKHVVMKQPENTDSCFFNYKGTFSIVLMALVDADYEFIYVDIGCNGRISDGGVFRNCSLSKEIEHNNLNILPPRVICEEIQPLPYVIVADDAFPLKENIMTALPTSQVTS